MTTKSIDWSYSSSANAARAGMRRTGCWTVSTHTAPGFPVAIKHFGNREEAITFAKTLPEPFSEIFLRYNPELRNTDTP